MSVELGTPVRVLFCIGILPAFFSADADERQAQHGVVQRAFEDLRGRFGVEVIGTFDDDRLMVGSSAQWPWTCYVLADVPDLDAAVAVCNIIRETPVGDTGHRLWRYMRIEARVGRQLFFANE